MKRKGFTLVELLVVIAIIALLMGILMPALARVRQIAFRLVCGTNLSGIGKAMLIYANDYEDELPRAGGPQSTWVQPGGVVWNAGNRIQAYNLGAGPGVATISSCFYLLVKYAEVTPKSFLCKGDTGAREFKASDEIPGVEAIQLWDFGATPVERCSYSYHMPFLAAGQSYALTTSSEPGMAIAADRNPWQKDASGTERPDSAPGNEPSWQLFAKTTRETIKAGNCLQHQDEGQNVLFLDGSERFEKSSACGIDDDVIYTFQDASWKGAQPGTGNNRPTTRRDSFLVHDGEEAGQSGGPDPKRIGCFVAETPVWVDGSLVEISSAEAGQKLGKADCISVTVEAQKIEAVQEHEGSYTCRDVELDSGNTISVVDAHCFMLDSGRWVAAQDLKSGMKLRTQNGSVSIESVVVRPEPFAGKVYNLKMEGTDRYPVGKDGVIVRDY